jgi:hypothetical protein
MYNHGIDATVTIEFWLFRTIALANQGPSMA